LDSKIKDLKSERKKNEALLATCCKCIETIAFAAVGINVALLAALGSDEAAALGATLVVCGASYDVFFRDFMRNADE
jgi:hypothetical protein